MAGVVDRSPQQRHAGAMAPDSDNSAARSSSVPSASDLVLESMALGRTPTRRMGHPSQLFSFSVSRSDTGEGAPAKRGGGGGARGAFCCVDASLILCSPAPLRRVAARHLPRAWRKGGESASRLADLTPMQRFRRGVMGARNTPGGGGRIGLVSVWARADGLYLFCTGKSALPDA